MISLQERERQFKEFEQKHLGSKEDIELKIKQDTENTIREMEKRVNENKQQVFKEFYTFNLFNTS